jgi:hypothetical protein
MKMDTKLSQSATWTLILGGFALLVAMGKLDLLVVLIPTAAVLAYGISWIFQGKTSDKRLKIEAGPEERSESLPSGPS